MQNRTLAGGAGTTDQSSMLDIANNPLDGRLYSGLGNGAIPKFADNSASLVESFFGDRESGIIAAVPDTALGNWTQEMYDNYRRPPSSGSFQGVKKTCKISLKPGEIRTSFVNYRKNMSVNEYFQRNQQALYQYTRGGTAAPMHFMGNFRFYGFEKRCNTTVDEPDISVGYEMNTHITCAIYERPVFTIFDTRVI